MTPKHPDVAADLEAPVLEPLRRPRSGHFRWTTVEKMRAGLKSSCKPAEVVVYPQVPHGFHVDYRPSYRKEAAEYGWRRLQARL